MTAALHKQSPSIFDTANLTRSDLELRNSLWPIERQVLKAHYTPLVSVVILNHNGAAVLPRCLEALKAQTYKNFEIVIVDNNSQDGSLSSVEAFKDKLNISIKHSKTNLGVAGGRNAAMELIKGDIVAFIDNDGFAERHWINNSLFYLCADPTIGAIAPTVFFDDRKLILNGTGGTMNLQGFAADINYATALELAQRPTAVLYPMGCGMVMPRSVAQKIFPLDATLPKWFDDTEIGIRIWKLGLKVIWANDVVVDHLAHSQDKKRIASGWRRALLFEKARVRNVLKYFPIKFLPLWLINEIKLSLIEGLRGKISQVAVRTIAWIWNLINLISVMKIRITHSGAVQNFWPLLDRSWGNLSTALQASTEPKQE